MTPSTIQPFPGLDALASGVWERYRADVADKSARDELLMIYKPLALWAAKSEIGKHAGYYRYDQGFTLDDLRQIAALCLLDLIKSYKPAKNDSFAAYASNWLQARIRAAVRVIGWGGRYGVELRDHRISGDVQQGHESETVLEKIEDSTDGPEISAELADFRESMLSRLNDDRDRTVFSLKFLAGLSSREIGGQLGISESMVCIIINRNIIPSIAGAFPDAAAGLRKRIKRAFHATHKQAAVA